MDKKAMMDIEKLLTELTIEEKVALVSGTDFMFTNPIPRLSIPSLRMADGPHGLRVQEGSADNGVTKSHPATSFPTAAALASSWNVGNAKKMGAAIAKECKHYGVHILLGPGVNIKRNPLAGRNFEYFAEDPLLAGKMAVFEAVGVQSEGVGVCVKHFALNNSENYRFTGDSIADMRAIREIYLKVFEQVVKEAKPYCLMSAYNKINGTFCAENKWLLTDVLRDEWGFDGVVMTDWGGIRDRVAAIKAGLDLEMPGDTPICRRRLLDGISSGELKEEALDKAVRNILRLIEKCVGQGSETPDFEGHHLLSAEIATDSAVLLKNDGVLPLNKAEGVFVVGELFEKMRYQGAGSSMINPTRLTTPKAAFDERNIRYDYKKGYLESETKTDERLIEEAVEGARSYQTVLAFVGLTDYVESEGKDRENMRLPENQLALIDGLIKAGKKVVVVLYGGSTCELPFGSKVSAILNMLLPGQNGGEATARLLFGEACPSGRLAETWLKSYEKLPFHKEFSTTQNEVYKESVFVGYRYFTSKKEDVLYPFGYGLSYTKFEYEHFTAEDQGEEIKLSCEVKNVGEFDGAEVVQVYVKAPKTNVYKPEKELRAFTKVHLKKGEKKTVELTVEKADLRYFFAEQNRWVLEGGRYSFLLSKDCHTPLYEVALEIEGERLESPYSTEAFNIYDRLDFDSLTDEKYEEISGVKIPPLPPKTPITMESLFPEIRRNFIGRLIYWGVTGLARKQIKRAKKMPDGAERDNTLKGGLFLLRIFETECLRAMSMSAGARFPYNFAEGVMHFANGKLFKGLKCFLSKIKVPKLPKDRNKKNT